MIACSQLTWYYTRCNLAASHVKYPCPVFQHGPVLQVEASTDPATTSHQFARDPLRVGALQTREQQSTRRRKEITAARQQYGRATASPIFVYALNAGCETNISDFVFHADWPLTASKFNVVPNNTGIRSAWNKVSIVQQKVCDWCLLTPHTHRNTFLCSFGQSCQKLAYIAAAKGTSS